MFRGWNMNTTWNPLYLKTILATACLYWVVSTAMGQTNPPVMVSGAVIAPDGRPVKGALVVLSSSRTNQEYRTRTDTTGVYRLSAPPGVYRLRIEPPPGYGLATKEIRELDVSQQKDYVLGEVIVKFQPDKVILPDGKSGAPIQEVTVTDSAVAELNEEVGVTYVKRLLPDWQRGDTLSKDIYGRPVILIDFFWVYILLVPPTTDIPAVAKQYKSLPAVIYAEPNGFYYPTGSPQLKFNVMLDRSALLPGDFDGNGKVDFDDFFLFADAFGQKASGDNVRFDLDQNGEVDFNDFFLFAEKFGQKTSGP
ncbi:MAG: hypothetical protein A3F84_02595 [Candidatus Handelsmanbacteria bacterium RIFCSPLOWO2_12_FULL_64_10]|uniref:EF-hand domain-containing protein n=1 Tax=Handelsmanbacteria sp. (strain RIFCSPLOWO2_12_FULL_64_10) TaxID=1817868 RepID=A0A1F6CLH6_HANXR|nr:MAG: hypothetical protein A3F84_02595 [Candidatus Handelsmanbacteria bacterium RIFCSPLOWO2_12_FULL_64_10]